MSELIYQIFRHLIDVPYNFWAWLLFTTAPILIFAINSKKSFWLHLGKLTLAIGLTYILINLTLYTHRFLTREAYNICQSQFSDGAIQHHEKCGEVNIADGASNVFYVFFGWIPAAGYVGFWELLWWIIYRKQIKQIGKDYKGKWLSNIFIFISIPIGGYIGYTIFLLAYHVLFKNY